jgi:hypothetical protein
LQQFSLGCVCCFLLHLSICFLVTEFFILKLRLRFDFRSLQFGYHLRLLKMMVQKSCCDFFLQSAHLLPSIFFSSDTQACFALITSHNLSSNMSIPLLQSTPYLWWIKSKYCTIFYDFGFPKIIKFYIISFLFGLISSLNQWHDLSSQYSQTKL